MSTATLHNEKKKALVPQLRFPGFKGEWEKKKIGSVLIIGSGRDYKHLENGNIPVFGTGGLMTYVNKFLYDGETVCIGRKGTIDKPMFYNGKIWTVDTLFYTHSFNSSLPKFIYNVFQRINWKEHNEASGVPSLSKSTIEKIKINLPTFPEQQKIASFLSAVDEKIQQLSRKKELVEQYKKGVMQQLFSGKLRFKDENGNEYPDWEEKKLGDAATITMGQSPDSKSYNTDSQGTLLIQGNADIKERVTSPRQWTNAPTKTCQIGDLILTVRAPVGSVAKSMHYACIGRGVCSIINKKKAVQEFLYQFLIGYETKWGSLEQGSTFTAVSGNEIKGLKINLPSLPEQQKIANFLLSIDVKIENTKDELEKVQTFKKGLLQQLFV